MVEIPHSIYSRYVQEKVRTTADCGPGWLPLILEIDQALSAIKPDYKIFNVKEKYGRLDYQLATQSNMDMSLPKKERLHKCYEFECVANDIAYTSSRVCEECGGPGRHLDDGCERIRCFSCEAAKEYECTPEKHTPSDWENLAKFWLERCQALETELQLIRNKNTKKVT